MEVQLEVDQEPELQQFYKMLYPTHKADSPWVLETHPIPLHPRRI